MTDNTVLALDISNGNQVASLTSAGQLGHLFFIGDSLYSLTPSKLDKLLIGSDVLTK